MSEAEMALAATMENYRHVPRDAGGNKEVTRSRDLDRILAIPDKRLLGRPPDLTEELRKPGVTPAQALWPIQNQALWEARQANGLVGFMLAGAGKSGTALLLPTVMNSRNAVIITQSQLRGQMWTHDVPMWANNYDVRLNIIRILSYQEISREDHADELEKNPPDLLILDEADSIVNRHSARNRRLRRFHANHPACRLAAFSATLIDDSIEDYAFFLEWALGTTCPVPLDWAKLQEWKKVLDPDPRTEKWGAGALHRLQEWATEAHERGPDGNKRVSVMKAYKRRLWCTLGVVFSGAIEVNTVVDGEKKPVQLFMHEREIEPNAANLAGLATIRTFLEAMRSTDTRPDGEVLEGPLRRHAALKQMGSGFYLRHAKELVDPALWRRYEDARGAWHKAVNQQLRRASVPGMDTPMQLGRAADRLLCVSYGCKRYQREAKHPDGLTLSPRDRCPECNGPLEPHWHCPEWQAWKAVRDLVKPESYPVWFSSTLVEDAVLWGRQYVGIIWYSSPAVGEAIAAVGGFPLFGDGTKAGHALIEENNKHLPTRTVVASIKCHGTGKNLTAWSNCLMAETPANAKAWEQVLARPHREGQKNPRVDFWVYRHTKEVCAALDTALMKAKFGDAHGLDQRMLMAQKTFQHVGEYADKELLAALERSGEEEADR